MEKDFAFRVGSATPRLTQRTTVRKLRRSKQIGARLFLRCVDCKPYSWEPTARRTGSPESPRATDSTGTRSVAHSRNGSILLVIALSCSRRFASQQKLLMSKGSHSLRGEKRRGSTLWKYRMLNFPHAYKINKQGAVLFVPLTPPFSGLPANESLFLYLYI